MVKLGCWVGEAGGKSCMPWAAGVNGGASPVLPMHLPH